MSTGPKKIPGFSVSMGCLWLLCASQLGVVNVLSVFIGLNGVFFVS